MLPADRANTPRRPGALAHRCRCLRHPGAQPDRKCAEARRPPEPCAWPCLPTACCVSPMAGRPCHPICCPAFPNRMSAAVRRRAAPAWVLPLPKRLRQAREVASSLSLRGKDAKTASRRVSGWLTGPARAAIALRNRQLRSQFRIILILNCVAGADHQSLAGELCCHGFRQIFPSS